MASKKVGEKTMPRGSKSIDSVKGHRTKAEKEWRKNAENSLKTGQKLKEFPEVKKDDIAHKQFQRVKKLLTANDKNDDMYSAVINRYCLLYSECQEYERLKDAYSRAIIEISEDKELIVEDFAVNCTERETISLAEYYKLKANFSKTIISLDSALMSKRKMMLDIEKENLMTVASGLRSIPKKPEDKKANPLIGALMDDD